MFITMLGVGNGFSPGVYDNNALVEHRGQKAMIDCGTTAWHSLYELGVPREEVGAVFLTHLHFDHAGGVESAALYGAHVSGQKLRLILPRPLEGAAWRRMLRAGLENRHTGMTGLSDYFQVETSGEGEPFLLCGGLWARWFRTKHIPGKFSCGLVIGEKLLYTSDMVCSLPLLTRMAAAGVEVIFHDCQLAGAQVHGDFATLCGFPGELRRRIFLMHHGLSEEAPHPDPHGMRFLHQHRRLELEIPAQPD